VAEAGSAAGIAFLTVADSAIEDAAASIGAARGSLVAHVSGSRDVSALEAAGERGALVGSFHPLAAVARDNVEGRSPESFVETFRGAAFALEGTAEVVGRLEPLARALGGHPFTIAAHDKPLYHLGASMLAAFAGGLAQMAWDRMRAAGVPPALASLGVGHLLRTVADNIAVAPEPAAALTGPVARGDARGVRRQALAAEALSPEVLAIYRVHVAHNIRLAERAGRIDSSTADQLLKALSE
jgi:predicted short-subunit dehydrogenase-like oxidoreductase (DUF2520 family)